MCGRFLSILCRNGRIARQACVVIELESLTTGLVFGTSGN
jgi:hypothetical protein